MRDSRIFKRRGQTLEVHAGRPGVSDMQDGCMADPALGPAVILGFTQAGFAGCIKALEVTFCFEV